MTSSFRKVFWPALLAAALFAAVGFSADKTSAQVAVVNWAGDGDVCRIASTTGAQARVGETFSVLARWQDAFFANARWAKDDDGDIATPDNAPPGDDLNPGTDHVFGFMFTLGDVINADVDDQDGNMDIVAKYDDGFNVHSLTWAILGGISTLIGWGHVDHNAVANVDFINDLDVIHVLSTDGSDPDDFDSLENWSPSGPLTDAEAAALAAVIATECGDPSFAPNELTLNNFIAAYLLGDLFALASLPAIGEVELAMDGITAVDLECFEPGSSTITFSPLGTFQVFGILGPINDGLALYGVTAVADLIDLALQDNPEGASYDIECIGGAHSATVAQSPTAGIEVHPVGTNVSVSTITVTAMDQNGRRVDGVTVTFTSDDCRLGASPTGPFTGTTLVTSTDTDTAPDTQFVADHAAAGDELFAGTAEAYLQCDNTGQATPTNNDVLVTYVVDGAVPSGTGLTGSQTVKVTGEPFALTLAANPTTSTCGSAVQITATVTDSLGSNVSDGTEVFFTGPNDVGITGGGSSAQGGILTSGGKATVTVSPGQGLANGTSTITISAITGGVDKNGHNVKQVSNSITITCTGPTVSAPAAPNVTAPNTGTGAIKPPNTGDAGLVDESSWSLFAVAGVVAFAVAGLATLKFAR